MAVVTCKQCGAPLPLISGQSVVACEYCGVQQTIPALDDEKKLTLFGRANRLRFACEFDKAAGIYEAIVAEFPSEAEAYWGLVLCKYGIEYVDDPATGKKIPTCHRSSFNSVMDDSDLEQAMENADSAARKLYRAEAKQIEQLRQGILAVSSQEAPYDIFICYKETAENGDRTLDSVLAQDVYDALTAKGYRVFFSRITLEDKLGQEYEPYIFAALNSAKIMLAFGTDYDYFNAVWVKNEWSRFLQLMAQDKTKHLIPCYKGIDAYDMPKEFAKLQAQDLGKVGAIQDLLRGIEKLMPKAEKAEESASLLQQTVQQTSFGNDTDIRPLLTRAFLYLEDGAWKTADEYCERVLDKHPECAEAYLGKMMATLECHQIKNLQEQSHSFDDDPNYRKAMRFASEKLRAELAGYNAQATQTETLRAAETARAMQRKKRKRVTASIVTGLVVVVAFLSVLVYMLPQFMYYKALELMESGEYAQADELLSSIAFYKDSETLSKECIYRSAIVCMEAHEYEKASALLNDINPYLNSEDLLHDCKYLASIDKEYNQAVKLMKQQRYTEAIEIWVELSRFDYRDSNEKLAACRSAIVAENLKGN